MIGIFPVAPTGVKMVVWSLIPSLAATMTSRKVKCLAAGSWALTNGGPASATTSRTARERRARRIGAPAGRVKVEASGPAVAPPRVSIEPAVHRLDGKSGRVGRGAEDRALCVEPNHV